jgi:hypothetical protein
LPLPHVRLIETGETGREKRSQQQPTKQKQKQKNPRTRDPTWLLNKQMTLVAGTREDDAGAWRVIEHAWLTLASVCSVDIAS